MLKSSVKRLSQMPVDFGFRGLVAFPAGALLGLPVPTALLGLPLGVEAAD
jgi:hypothetical protein